MGKDFGSSQEPQPARYERRPDGTVSVRTPVHDHQLGVFDKWNRLIVKWHGEYVWVDVPPK